MEMLFALIVILLSAGGLALGLVLTGRAPQGSCGGLACGGKCAACPRRKEEADG